MMQIWDLLFANILLSNSIRIGAPTHLSRPSLLEFLSPTHPHQEGITRQRTARPGPARPDSARHGTARHGTARPESARTHMHSGRSTHGMPGLACWNAPCIHFTPSACRTNTASPQVGPDTLRTSGTAPGLSAATRPGPARACAC